MSTKYFTAINEASQIYFNSEQVLLATEVSPYVVGLILKSAKKLGTSVNFKESVYE